MLKYLDEAGYLGIFLTLIASGLGFPIPEELPVVTAGVLVGHDESTLKWYIMLPVVMAGVVISDAFLYGMGRLWGTRILNLKWVQRRLLTPEKRSEIEKNLHDRGIAVLLGARLLPGIRTPIFLLAGMMRVPLGRFMLADALYAIPGVNLLFWLAYFLTDQALAITNKLEEYRPLVVVAVLSGIAGALIQKYVFSRHVSTGEPPQVPDVISKPAGAVAHAVEKAAVAVAHATHVSRRPDEAKAEDDPAPSLGVTAADAPKPIAPA